MEPFSNMGKILIFLGAFLILIGIFFVAGQKIPLLGKLPGDITIRGKNSVFYFPIVTSIILSILLTIILNLFFRR